MERVAGVMRAGMAKIDQRRSWANKLRINLERDIVIRGFVAIATIIQGIFKIHFPEVASWTIFTFHYFRSCQMAQSVG